MGHYCLVRADHGDSQSRASDFPVRMTREVGCRQEEMHLGKQELGAWTICVNAVRCGGYMHAATGLLTGKSPLASARVDGDGYVEVFSSLRKGSRCCEEGSAVSDTRSLDVLGFISLSFRSKNEGDSNKVE